MSAYLDHSVTTSQSFVTGCYVARCSCGAESRPSTHKPVVDAWRKQHYDAARRGSNV